MRVWLHYEACFKQNSLFTKYRNRHSMHHIYFERHKLWMYPMQSIIFCHWRSHWFRDLQILSSDHILHPRLLSVWINHRSVLMLPMLNTIQYSQANFHHGRSSSLEMSQSSFITCLELYNLPIHKLIVRLLRVHVRIRTQDDPYRLSKQATLPQLINSNRNWMHLVCHWCNLWIHLWPMQLRIHPKTRFRKGSVHPWQCDRCSVHDLHS